MSLSNLLQSNSYELYCESLHCPNINGVTGGIIPGPTGPVGPTGPNPLTNTNPWYYIPTPSSLGGTGFFNNEPYTLGGPTITGTTGATGVTGTSKIHTYTVTLAPTGPTGAYSYCSGGILEVSVNDGTHVSTAICDVYDVAIIDRFGTITAASNTSSKIVVGSAIGGGAINATGFPIISGNQVQFGISIDTSVVPSPINYEYRYYMEVPSINTIQQITFP